MTPEPEQPPRHGLGDPRIPWVVLLELAISGPAPTAAELQVRLRAVAAEAGWPDDAVGEVRCGDRRDLLTSLAAEGSVLLGAGTHSGGLVVAGRHDALDGLALLGVAGRLAGVELTSAVRGVGADRSHSKGLPALLARAWEVLVRPQARIVVPVPGDSAGDSFAAVTVEGDPGTADLIHAGSRAVVAWNREHERETRRVSVAVGVSTAGGTRDLADRSGFLRLRGVERLDRAAVAAALRTAPLQPGGGNASGGATAGVIAARAIGAAARLAAPRLGSTLLVSHLGRVGTDVPPAFYPVTGGDTGLSVGAATAAGRTTITARARATRYADEELEHLLELLTRSLQ